MKAWGDNQGVGDKIFMMRDPFLNFTKAIGAEVDKSEKGLGIDQTDTQCWLKMKLLKNLR